MSYASRLTWLLLTLAVVSCGAPSGYFRLEGRFRNFNQGEFYLYSLDGGRGRLDTIRVADGRFAFEMPVTEPAIYSLVFPNYSELPVFTESGATVEVQGDASHLKEVKVTGTKENDQMTDFRLKVAQMTPPETLKTAEKFIKEHPQAQSSVYLLNKYFLMIPDVDYRKAAVLASLIAKGRPQDDRATVLAKRLQTLKEGAVDDRLPAFAAVDVRGQRVSNALLTGELNIINVWSTWNYDSQNVMRQLRQQKKTYGQRLGLVSICLDASQRDCRGFMDRDSISWSVVCDGRMWESPVMQKLGLADIPANIVTDRAGRVLARNMDLIKLKEKIKSTLK
jgi:hypothetical protein